MNKRTPKWMHLLQCRLFDLLPQHGLSRLAGYLAESKIIWLKNLLIRWFIRHYKIDLSAAQSADLADYACFNAFFTRQLKAELRPINRDARAICSPVDGRISQFGKIHQESLIQAKGIDYSLFDLLQDEPSYMPFVDGQFITLYLSPRDYHRVHMPMDGELYRADYIPGTLFPVNQSSANHVRGLFSRNERLVCYFNTPMGDFVLIMVGAMLVAGIETVWSKAQQNQLHQKPLPYLKGEEIGRFKFGSTVILLFNKQTALQWQTHVQADKALCFGETLAKPAMMN